MAEQRRNPTKQSSKRKSSSSPSILDRLAHLEAGLAGAQKEISFKEIDEMLTMCMQNHENLAALMNCKNILCLLDENSDGPIYDKYSAILTQLRQKELEKNQLKWTEI